MLRNMKLFMFIECWMVLVVWKKVVLMLVEDMKLFLCDFEVFDEGVGGFVMVVLFVLVWVIVVFNCCFIGFLLILFCGVVGGVLEGVCLVFDNKERLDWFDLIDDDEMILIGFGCWDLLDDCILVELVLLVDLLLLLEFLMLFCCFVVVGGLRLLGVGLGMVFVWEGCCEGGLCLMNLFNFCISWVEWFWFCFILIFFRCVMMVIVILFIIFIFLLLLNLFNLLFIM